LQSVLDSTTRPGPVLGAPRRYQVAVEDLCQEMFVADLDRPWLDTPFLLQGFMIDSQVELDTLRKYCEYVYVDLELSSPAVADLIRRVEIRPPELEPDTVPMKDRAAAVAAIGKHVAHAAPGSSATPEGTPQRGDVPGDTRPMADRASSQGTAGSTAASDATVIHAAGSPGDTPRKYRQRADIKISQVTRQRFRQLVRQTADARAEKPAGPIARCVGWLMNLFDRERNLERNGPPTIPADLLPEGTVRVKHEDRHGMTAELPRARAAFDRSQAVLSDLAGDIRNGRAPELTAVESAVDTMVDSMLDNPDALMWIARLREEDPTTYNHGVKVALYLVALGRHLGFPRNELAYLGQIGMLADIGKTRISRAILEKPGMLTPAEFEIVKEHVDLAVQVLANGPKLPRSVMTGIEQHHERIDGSGYPKGLKSNQISIYGRMTAIADSFAALITPRAYANASAPQDALMNLYEWCGTSFHEPLVEQFVQAIGVFPVGSMIELTSGEIAVVVAHNRIRRLEPKVLVLSNPDKTPLAQPVERDLFREAKARARDQDDKPMRIARGLPAGAFGFRLRDYYLDEIAKQNGIAA
jgi:HD-GYP domain-containing protein (c-di-GMP phosphodiesterase class II)